MKEPLTEELLQELLEAPDPSSFTDKHKIGKRTLAEYLQQLLDEHDLSRNKILQLAFAMGLTLKEANRLLQAAGSNELYCKNRHDAIIIFCLEHKSSIQEVDEELYNFGEDTIC